MIGNDDEKEIEDEGKAESGWDSLRRKSGESASVRDQSVNVWQDGNRKLTIRLPALMRGPAASRGLTKFPRVGQAGERRRSCLTASPNCAKAQSDNPAALSLKVTFPRKGKEPAKVFYGKIKSPPAGPMERDDVRTIGSPHTSPSRKENVKRIRVDVAHPMSENYSSSCPWGKPTGDNLQHAFIIE